MPNIRPTSALARFVCLSSELSKSTLAFQAGSVAPNTPNFTSSLSLFQASDAKQSKPTASDSSTSSENIDYPFSNVSQHPSIHYSVVQENDFQQNGQALPKTQRRPGALLAFHRPSRVVQSSGTLRQGKKDNVSHLSLSRSLALSLSRSLALSLSRSLTPSLPLSSSSPSPSAPSFFLLSLSLCLSRSRSRSLSQSHRADTHCSRTHIHPPISYRQTLNPPHVRPIFSVGSSRHFVTSSCGVSIPRPCAFLKSFSRPFRCSQA